MTCTLDDFFVGSRRSLASRVDVANAATKNLRLHGVVYWVDGVFQGFTGDDDAALFHAARKVQS